MTANFRWFGLVATILTVAFSTACETEYSVGLTGSDMDRVDTLQSGGLTRTFAAHLPDDYEAGSSPVVIVLHGIRAIGQSLQYISAFDIDADQWGFLVAYPDATSDWATGCNCTAADSAGVDDVQFIADLLDKLDADYGINRDSVFVVGYSEGAFMAQKLVCDATDSFVSMAHGLGHDVGFGRRQLCSDAGDSGVDDPWHRRQRLSMGRGAGQGSGIVACC